MNYLKIYNNLVYKRKHTDILVKSKNLITELHHIVPRSISHDDSTDNLVRLTAKEHFICHLLLVKIYENDQVNYNKMLAALHCVSYFDGKYNKINSRLYEKIRIQICKMLSIAATKPRKRRRSKSEMVEWRQKLKDQKEKECNCRYCGKLCKNYNSVRNHERFCKKNPNAKESPFVNYCSNKPAWNKGLTKVDPRIEKFSKTLKEKYQKGEIVAHLKGKTMSDVHKMKISQGMKRHFNHI